MDRAAIIQHLDEAERHVREEHVHVINQRTLIEDMELGGHDTSTARALLKQLEDLQQLHISDRNRLRQELADSE